MRNKWLVVWGLSGFLALTSCASSVINNPEYYSSRKASALFTASNRASGKQQIWQANNTGDKLSPLPLPGNTSTGDADIGNLVSLGNIAVFTAYHAKYGRELWRTDGTEKGTYLLKDTLPGSASGMNDNSYSFDRENPITSAVTEQGDVFFWSNTAQGMTLWKTDGTPAGTLALKSFPRSVGIRLQNATLPRLIILGKIVFFRADDGQHGTEFWYSDGTKPGTKLLLDASKEVPDKKGYLPDSGGLTNADFRLTEQYLYFTARNLIHHDYKQPFSTTLWRIARNTTEAIKVKQLSSTGTSFTTLLYADKDSVYYYQPVDNGRQFDNGSQVDLWVLDIATEKTRRLGRLGGEGKHMGGSLYNPLKISGFLYFWYAGADKNNSNISELWRISREKIQKVFTVPDNEGHHGSKQYAFADQVFFAAHKNPQTPGFVWRSDSRSAAPEPVAIRLDQDKVAWYLRIQQYFFIEVNDHLLFSIPDEKQERPIVRAISKEDPQQAVAVGSFNSFIPVTPSLSSTNDGLLFINGDEIWQTDGTQSGTRKLTTYSHSLKDWQQDSHWINGLEQPFPDITPVKLSNGKLLFNLNDRRYGSELWVSDGSTQGTKLVKDINTAPAGPEISDLIQAGSTWYFIREGRLWFSDGSSTGTKEITEIPEHQVPQRSDSSIAAAETGQYAYAITRQKTDTSGSEFLHTLWRLNNDQAVKLKTFRGFVDLSSGRSAAYMTEYLTDNHQGKQQHRFVVWKITDITQEPTLLIQSLRKSHQHRINLSGETESGFLYSTHSTQTGASDTFVFNEATRTSKQIEAPFNPLYFNTAQRFIRLTTPTHGVSQTSSVAVFDAQKQDFKILAEFPNQYPINAVSMDNGLFFLLSNQEQGSYLWHLADDQQTLQQVKQFPPEQAVRFSKAIKQHLYLNVTGKQTDISLTSEFTQVWISDGTATGTRKIADGIQID